MAGLNPEQIAQIRGYEISGEKTRQQPIGAMIEAQLGLGRQGLEEQRIAVQQAEEARKNALFPAQLEFEKARTRSTIATAGLHESQRAQYDALSALEKQKLQAEVSGLDARTAAARMGERLDEERLKNAALQGPLELEKTRAEIEYRKRSTEDIGAARQQAKDIFESTNVPTTLPGGYEKMVPAKDIYETLTGEKKGGGTTDYQRIRIQDLQQQRSRQSREDEIKLQDDSRKAEANILGKNTRGGFNIQDPSVVTDMEEFNRKSDRDYFYKYIPPIKGVPDWMGGAPEHRRIPLVSREGKPLQARAVYQAWEEFKTKNGPISLEDYVKKFLGGPK